MAVKSNGRKSQQKSDQESNGPSSPTREVVPQAKGTPLAPRHQAFVNEYIQSWNGCDAYKKVYGVKDDATARANASRLLRNPQIKARITEMAGRAAEQAEITVEYILTSAREVVVRCLERVPVMRFDHQKKKMVQQTDSEGERVCSFDADGAMKALTLLSKHTGGFSTDTTSGGSPIAGLLEPQICVVGGQTFDMNRPITIEVPNEDGLLFDPHTRLQPDVAKLDEGDEREPDPGNGELTRRTRRSTNAAVHLYSAPKEALTLWPRPR
jgi:hypothetical protein